MDTRQTVELFLSDSLKSLLEEIKESSSIASLLLKKEHYAEDLIDNHIDYLSISDSDHTKISYLSRDRIEKVDEGMNIWTSSKRFHGRPGSVINKIFKDMHLKDIEVFNNLYRSALTKIKFNFQIVEGEDIRKYYSGDRYKSGSGSLGVSCMKYEACQKFFGIYVDNPSIIKMLIMLDDNDFIMGRALLWDIGDDKIMDRIYTINDEELPYHFKKWAISNNYIYKHEQKWNNSLMFESNGEKIEKQLQIKLNSFKYDKYPYLDTFKFFDRNNGIIYNYLPENDSIKTICAPDGSILPGDYLMHDFKTNLFQHRGEMVPIYYLDGNINRSSTIRTHSPNTDFSRINDLYILKDDSKYSNEFDDFIFNEKLDHLNNMENMEAIRKQMSERMQKEKIKVSSLRHRFMGTSSYGEFQDSDEAVEDYSQRSVRFHTTNRSYAEIRVSSEPEPDIPNTVSTQPDLYDLGILRFQQVMNGFVGRSYEMDLSNNLEPPQGNPEPQVFVQNQTGDGSVLPDPGF